MSMNHDLGYLHEGRDIMLFFNRKKRPSVDPATVQRLQQIRDLYMESADIMTRTENLTTFLSRYEDARRFISGFNSTMVQVGQAPILEMNGDIDELFVRRIGEVVTLEIAAAQKLKTTDGQKERLQRILDRLERVERTDDGLIDNAIMEAEDQIFRVMYQGTDWSKEPDSAGLSVSGDMMMEAIRGAVAKEGRRRGLSEDQIEETWRKVFEK